MVEEVGELKALGEDDPDALEDEFGDVLFSMVNAARWLGVDAEGALRHSNARFYGRYTAMERTSRQRGLTFPDLSLDEKEDLWQEAKRQEVEQQED